MDEDQTPNRMQRRHPDDWEDRLLSIEELARRWGIPTQSVYNMRMAGEGPPSMKLGDRRVRYRLSDVIAWEDDQIAKAS